MACNKFIFNVVVMRWIKYDDVRGNEWNLVLGGATANKTRRSREFVIPQSISSFVSLLNPRIVIRSSSHCHPADPFQFPRICLPNGIRFRSRAMQPLRVIRLLLLLSSPTGSKITRWAPDWIVTGHHYYSLIQLTALCDWSTVKCIFNSLLCHFKRSSR